MAKRITRLIGEIQRSPFAGICTDDKMQSRLRSRSGKSPMTSPAA
ncbi:hypothetical protein V3664_03940 [Streptomyces sp. CS62]|jgi:Txe/YoeB family toxin of Txe-Axe toxin-antitoxin module